MATKLWEGFELALCVAACAAVALALTGGMVGLVAMWLLRFQGGI